MKRTLILLLLVLKSSMHVLAQAKFPQPISETETGFNAIFNGVSLENWEGDPTYWRVEKEQIIGEVTPETILKRNSFLIWRGGAPEDFELKLEYKVSEGGNSGINYRSVEVKDTPYALKGYQCDIDGKGKWAGQNYEERGRKFLAMRGQMTQLKTEIEPTVYGSLGDKDKLWEYIKKDDWNHVHLIVRGNTMIHIINGHVMSVVIDNDVENRTSKGFLGVQVHVGPPMTIAYKNIRIKE